MRAKQTIETLEKLIDKILDTSGNDRTILCMTIDSILDQFDDWLENSQDAKDMHADPAGATIFITRMKGPLYCLAGLNDYDTDMNNCVVQLLGRVNDLKTTKCLVP